MEFELKQYQCDCCGCLTDVLDPDQKLCDAFNHMGGSLYSGICADEMNEIIQTLNDTFGIDVEFYQDVPGRVKFTNLKTLIEEYESKYKLNRL